MILEDFYAEILQKLGVLAAEEAPSAADRLVAKTKYEQVHEEYSRRDIGVGTFFSDDEVPDWIADSMAAITAARLVNRFSVPQGKRIELKIDAVSAETTIVADGQRRETETSKSEYY